MYILLNNLQRLMKRKGLILLIAMPIIFTAVYMMGLKDVTFHFAVIDHDNSEASTWLVNGVVDKENINTLGDLSLHDIEQKIITYNYDFIITIPKGYEESLLTDTPLQITTYYMQNNFKAAAPKYLFDDRVAQINTLASFSKDQSELQTNLTQFDKGMVEITSRVVGQKDKGIKTISVSAIGILLMSMLFFSNSSGKKLNQDKENGMFTRIMASPISKRRYAFEAMSSLFIMLTLMVTCVFLIIVYVLNGNLGPNPLNVLIVVLCFSTVAVGITTFINSISNNIKQANTLSMLIITPICMLGGCFWPVSITPEPMQFISNFVPTKWAMDAVYKVASGATLNEVFVELMILAAFALVFFSLSSMKPIRSQ